MRMGEDPELQEPQLEALELQVAAARAEPGITDDALERRVPGARVIEHIARLRIQLPTSCPEGALFRAVALGLQRSWAAPPMINPKRGRPPAEIHWKAEQAWTICG